MKKSFLTLTIVLMSTLTFGQNNSIWNTSNCEKCPDNEFVFDRVTLAKLEKYAKFSTDYDVNTEEKKKDFIGGLLCENTDDASGEYIKLSAMPPGAKFILIGDNYELKKTLIQNTKTKFYCIINTSTFNYVDYERQAKIYKIVAKAPTAKELELITRYKALIKGANANMVVLQSIQKKYLTKGYFDAKKVNPTDKATYNKNLSDLKTKADKLLYIDRYEDKDDKAQDKLTMDEIASLSNINNWNMNYFSIN